MQTEPNAKQQIVEKIKNSTNILVTVGNNPSVDALSAALSLTLMLNRLDKHATAVFSGQLPPAINFLEPNKTFESTVDSLRDFIIALDKEKADRLRYKVEDDVVRIFITPYRTVISEKDLQFSQGDFNVELIVALGVEKREDLDMAVTAHGRILHDATVVTINADGGKPTLGSVDWTDPNASSLCEMLMSLSEALQSGLLDEQIATAVLTGIVAATDRFRNERTSPRVMTMAAQLMAAGANQQLIAAKLEEGHELPAVTATDGTTSLSEGQSEKLKEAEPAASAKPDDGSLEIEHTPEPDAAPLPDPSNEALKEAEQELEKSLEQTAAPAVAPTLSLNDLQSDLAAAAEELGNDTNDLPPLPPPLPEANKPKIIKQERNWRTEPMDDKPSFGGTLNATASDAEEEKRQEKIEQDKLHLLTHDEPGANSATPAAEQSQPEPASSETPAPAPAMPTDVPPVPTFDPAPVKPLESTSDDVLSFEPAPIEGAEPSLAEIDSQARGKAAEEARAAVDAALNAVPFDPAGQPAVSTGATPVFDVPHEQPASQEPPVAPQAEPFIQTPPLPPLPDFSTLPPLPGEAAPLPAQAVPFGPQPAPFDPGPTTDQFSAPAMTPPTPAPNDPGQFKIPGQP